MVGFQRKTSGGEQLLGSRVHANVRRRRWSFLLYIFRLVEYLKLHKMIFYVDGLFIPGQLEILHLSTERL